MVVLDIDSFSFICLDFILSPRLFNALIDVSFHLSHIGLLPERNTPLQLLLTPQPPRRLNCFNRFMINRRFTYRAKLPPSLVTLNALLSRCSKALQGDRMISRNRRHRSPPCSHATSDRRMSMAVEGSRCEADLSSQVGLSPFRAS